MNTNTNAKRILCFGDSNTWGYIPGTKHNRYPANIRWTGILQNILGNDFEIIEEGLNSRTFIKNDIRQGKEGRSAMDYIYPCLDTHDPLDYIIVALGANELKAKFELSPLDVAENLRTLIQAILSRPSQFRTEKPKIIVVVPSAIDDTVAYTLEDNKFVGAHEKSIGLKKAYAKVCTEMGCDILDIQDQLKVGVDGVHLTEDAHELLGRGLADLIINIQ